MSSRHREMSCTRASNPQLCAIHIGSVKKIAFAYFWIASTQKMPSLSPKTHISQSLIHVAGVQSLVSGCATRKGVFFISELMNRNLATKVVGTPRIGGILRLLPVDRWPLCYSGEVGPGPVAAVGSVNFSAARPSV